MSKMLATLRERVNTKIFMKEFVQSKVDSIESHDILSEKVADELETANLMLNRAENFTSDDFKAQSKRLNKVVLENTSILGDQEQDNRVKYIFSLE